MILRSTLTAVMFAAAFAMAIPEPVFADPPPWAPAHGYRAKQGKKHKHKKNRKYYEEDQVSVYVPPFDINLDQCNRQALGSVLGGAVGGALGSKVGDGSGKTAAVIGGTILGYLIGGAIGRHMDEIDQNCVGQILEYAEDRQSVEWRNPDLDARYQVTPVSTFQNGAGQYCREYTTDAVVGGRKQQLYGTACRQPDGSWRLAN